MFERYTETAQKVITTMRQVAGEYGGPDIKPEHLAIALLIEDPMVITHLLSPGLTHDNMDFAGFIISDPIGTARFIREGIESRTMRYEKIPPSEIIPVNHECKGILKIAAMEADRLGSPTIGTEHLLSAIVIVVNAAGIFLRQEYNVRPGNIRRSIVNQSVNVNPPRPAG